MPAAHTQQNLTQARKRFFSYLSALPSIQVHPELDGRTLDIVHCFFVDL